MALSFAFVFYVVINHYKVCHEIRDISSNQSKNFDKKLDEERFKIQDELGKKYKLALINYKKPAKITK